MKEKLLKQAERIGLLAELDVAEIFRENGFRLELNRYYNDRDDETGREIDLIAQYSKKTDTTKEDAYLEMVFNLIVEVKKSKNPWVFSSFPSDKFHENDTTFFRHISANFNKINLVSTLKKHLGEINNHLLGRNFSIINAHDDKAKSNDIPISSSFFTVAKVLCEEYFSQNYIRNSEHLSEKIFEYYELLVVVDTPIYEISIKKDKKNIVEVDEILVAFNYKSPNYRVEPVYFIRVINKAFLANFLKSRTEKFNKISKELLAREGEGRFFVN